MKRLVQASLLAGRLALIVVCFWPLLLGAQGTWPRLMWDEDSSSVTGFAVTIDGARFDYGLIPAADDGTCGCSVPLPFSGGRHTLVVSAYNDAGETPSDPLIVAPIASPGGGYTAQVGSLLTVDGSASSHPAGSIVQWRWGWGGPSPPTPPAPRGPGPPAYGATRAVTSTLTITHPRGA